MEDYDKECAIAILQECIRQMDRGLEISKGNLERAVELLRGKQCGPIKNLSDYGYDSERHKTGNFI